jgi:translation initiation factor IF-3
VPTSDALKRAAEQGADLVEVSPKEDPPVVKILDFGKFKYSLEKKKQKSKAKKVETKGIRLALNIAAHDREVKIKQAQKFLSKGDKTQLEMILKGRQMAHARRAYDQMGEIIKELADSAELIQQISLKGRRITALLQPKK